VLHRDADILVLDKPSGLLSVPGKPVDHADCLEARARAAFPDTLLVHRLDMDTSGVMIFALNKPAQRHLGLQFEKRYVRKTYIARVWGRVSDPTGTVDLPLKTDWPNRPKQMVSDDGRAAQTDWEELSRDNTATRLRLRPLTGRSHQLRVHMAAIGHPILGDRFYAQGAALAAADRLQLHAESLELRHPADGRTMVFEAPCPF